VDSSKLRVLWRSPDATSLETLMIARRLLLILIWLSLVPCGVHAQQQRMSIDPAKSEVHFKLDDPLHSVEGTFRVQQGSVMFDAQGGRISGLITVDAGSGDSGNGSRDKKMKNDELKAPTFSTVTFAPKSYSGTLALTGDSTITVDGAITLLGTPHDISVPMQVHLDGAQCKATGSFVIPYVKWGMKDPSNFVLRVGKEVTVNLVLVGSIAGGKFD